MRLFWRVVLTTTFMIAGGYHTNEAAGFQYNAGIGYDFLSQEYFLDSAAQSGVDSVLTDWSLRTDYLDDVKGILSFTVLPLNDRRLAFTTRYEQTSDFFRLKFIGDARANLGDSRLDLNGELDWRHRHDGEASFGDSYVYGYSRAKLAVPLNESVKSIFEVRGEFVQFDSVTTTSYNYYRVGGKIGLEKFFENFSFGDIKAKFQTRQAPDSSAMNYVNFGAEGTYFGFYTGGDIDLYANVERKDYNLLDGRNDFWRFELEGRNKVRLKERYFTSQEIDFEYMVYDPNDPVNLDYYILELTLLAGFESPAFTIGVGPEVEALHEAKDDFMVSGDYFEVGGKVDVDVVSGSRLFVSAESVLGYRDLKDNDDLITDYTYERVNLIGNTEIFKGLRFNVLFSAEWEWHTIATNDNKIFLVSSSLTYGM
ncbi:MAG: hypothetical protein AB1483_05250 [Candidatus Zixiibacteriota bacterium]